MAGWIKMPLGTEVCLGPGDFVLDGDPASLAKKGTEPPNFRPRGPAYCGQTAGCIKMPLGIEVGLSPGDIVLDGDPAPPSLKGGGAGPPQFSVYVYCGYHTWVPPHAYANRRWGNPARTQHSPVLTAKAEG